MISVESVHFDNILYLCLLEVIPLHLICDVYSKENLQIVICTGSTQYARIISELTSSSKPLLCGLNHTI